MFEPSTRAHPRGTSEAAITPHSTSSRLPNCGSLRDVRDRPQVASITGRTELGVVNFTVLLPVQYPPNPASETVYFAPLVPHRKPPIQVSAGLAMCDTQNLPSRTHAAAKDHQHGPAVDQPPANASEDTYAGSGGRSMRNVEQRRVSTPKLERKQRAAAHTCGTQLSGYFCGDSAISCATLELGLTGSTNTIC